MVGTLSTIAVTLSTTEDTEDTEEHTFIEKGFTLRVLRVLCGS
jgi:hypothetical protein